MTSVAERAGFDFIRYASVWEDADVLCEALAPVAAGHRLLSIASAGDNALALLTLDPSDVVAVDLSAAQLACVELRRAAFRELSYEELLAFLGVTATSDRLAVYGRLRAALPPEVQAFWDDRPEDVTRGVIHAGKFERYFAMFRQRVLPLVHSARTVQQLRLARSLAEQEVFYTTRWDSWRWRLLFRVFFSRLVMGRLGRDPAFFDHVEGAVSTRLLARTRYALTRVPVASNSYLAYILTGNYPLDALPRYLRPEWFACIRDRLDRLHTRQSAAHLVEGPFHGFNLSDIFEYMSADEFPVLYRALLDQAAPGARLVYWNMLAPRARPQSESRARSLTELAQALHRRDNAWFYTALEVDECVGGPTTEPMA